MNSVARQVEVKILGIIQEQRYMLLEQLLSCLPELTWNQVFMSVDELSRRELIRLRRRGFEYEVQAASLVA